MKNAERIDIGHCRIFRDGVFEFADVRLLGGQAEIKDVISGEVFSDTETERYLFPGFTDVHVHLREPGFSYKETVKSGTYAAANAGYTSLCSMPNLSPAPDCAESLSRQTEIIDRDAYIKVFPYGTITEERKGKQLSRMEEIADKVIAFTDDGSGVADEELMEAAMKKAAKLGKIIAAHAEDLTLIEKGGCIHAGEYAAKYGFPAISSESEWKQVERDLKLVAKTGCKYHVCHISTAETVSLIRQAKAAGLDVTCETAPHYLILSDKDLKDDGRFKMNPPLRSERDRQALLEGLSDGIVDMIATDHAPHSAEEKSKGLLKSAMGITGIETAFPLLYTELVRKKVITLEKLITLMSVAPAQRFGIKTGIDSGDFCLYDLSREYEIVPEKLFSMGKSTPFAGRKVFGKCLMTVCNHKTVYELSE